VNRILLESYPHLEIIEDLISPEICNKIISLLESQPNLFTDARLSDYQTGSLDLKSIKTGHKAIYNQKYQKLDTPEYREIIQQIKEKISNVTGLPKDNICDPVPTKYETNSSFTPHYDFFIVNDKNKASLTKMLSKGGNRMATAVLYLNNDYSGGETYFNHLYKSIWPNQGQLAFFRYDYDEPETNLKTLHTGKDIIFGTKYILTFFIKEFSNDIVVDTINPRSKERDFILENEDIEYELECGPDWDRRILKIDMPANTDPDNLIAVGLSGMDSMMVLYLISMLNKLQKIPYRIVPIVVIPNKKSNLWFVNWSDVKHMDTMIRNLINEPFLHRLLDCQVPEESDINWGCRETLINFYNKKDARWPERHRYWQPKFIYTGDHERPLLDEKWSDHGAPFIRSPVEWWVQPFYNLQKYHIIDIYYQLDLVDLLRQSGTCTEIHNDPYILNCKHYACNERRWALKTLGKYDLIPYLLETEHASRKN